MHYVWLLKILLGIFIDMSVHMILRGDGFLPLFISLYDVCLFFKGKLNMSIKSYIQEIVILC